MTQIDIEIAALRAAIRHHAITGMISAFELLRTISPNIPPPGSILELTVREIQDIERAYRIAYDEQRRISLDRWQNRLTSAIETRRSMLKQRKSPSTAPITKGS